MKNPVKLTRGQHCSLSNKKFHRYSMHKIFIISQIKNGFFSAKACVPHADS